jgi:ethanolamine utilization protein EutM
MANVNGQALGLVETMGLVAATEAADAMLKAANVHLISKQQVGGGLITILVAGDVGAVQAAVDAGRTAAAAVGKVISAHVIPRPHDDIPDILERPPVR